MRLVNCPICGKRCSADTEKCPECGFEIRQYFESNNVPEKRKKKPHFGAVCILCVIVFVFFTSIFILVRNSSKPKMDTIYKESTVGLVSNKNIDVSGVYSGDDNEILVLNSDGLAYYYCIDIQYTELACPWHIKDDTVYIELSRLHCIIFAKIDDEKELIFKSDSSNWNPELFTRINLEPEQYLTKIPATNDPKATLNRDGTISYTNDGTTYILPKMFMDFKDEFDSKEDSSCFIDQDTQSNYIASVVFHCSEGRELTLPLAEKLAQIFGSRFYENITISNSTKLEICGHQGYRFKATGYLNKGFNTWEGYEMDGSIIIFYNESTGNNNYIMMSQTSNRALDDTELFEDILKSAR
ncbi:hypothetical protein SAMN05216349_11455 [Oribacterium sp. KHPX15]|uniref:hypothetical protein n=1 Tax=Oribacterium sp. KHPX15 TaxID=1855342 RepID=UPI00089C0067|nr:hypothetical protein [Oribacterium sp. KHPX15]SEA49558.1 hypothetical protein SAMN05216349_11455 [Oribacterium sp. KHPX15]